MMLTLSKGVVDKIAVVIKDRRETPLERFIFSVHNVIYVDNTDVDKPCVISSRF